MQVKKEARQARNLVLGQIRSAVNLQTVPGNRVGRCMGRNDNVHPGMLPMLRK